MTNVTSLSFINRGLEKFPEIKESAVFVRLDISQNPIKNFEGMSRKYTVESIVANNTKIVSFSGIELQPKLSSISATGSPLGGNPCFPIMSLVLFGESLESVNGKLINAQERKLANLLRPYIVDDLIDGWVLMCTTPTVTLMNPVTRKRKMIVIDAPTSSKSTPEEEEDQNEEEEKAGSVEADDEFRMKFNRKRDDLNKRCRSTRDIKTTKQQKNSNDQSVRRLLQSKPTTEPYPAKSPPFEKRNLTSMRQRLDPGCNDDEETVPE